MSITENVAYTKQMKLIFTVFPRNMQNAVCILPREERINTVFQITMLK